MNRIFKLTETTQRTNVNPQLTKIANSIASQAKQVSNQMANIPKPIIKSDTNGPKASNNIRFSSMNEIKTFDPQETINLLSLLPNKRNTFPTTTKKVVHLDEIKQLKENVVSRIDELNSQIIFLMSNKQKISQNDVIAIKSEFNSLVDCINHYQSLLNDSSYKHHESKQATLDLLKNNILGIKSQQNFQSFIALNLHTAQVYNDKEDPQMLLVSLFKR